LFESPGLWPQRSKVDSRVCLGVRSGKTFRGESGRGDERVPKSIRMANKTAEGLLLFLLLLLPPPLSSVSSFSLSFSSFWFSVLGSREPCPGQAVDEARSMHGVLC